MLGSDVVVEVSGSFWASGLFHGGCVVVRVAGWLEESDVCYGCLESERTHGLGGFVKVWRLRADVKSEE